MNVTRSKGMGRVDVTGVAWHWWQEDVSNEGGAREPSLCVQWDCDCTLPAASGWPAGARAWQASPGRGVDGRCSPLASMEIRISGSQAAAL